LQWLEQKFGLVLVEAPRATANRSLFSDNTLHSLAQLVIQNARAKVARVQEKDSVKIEGEAIGTRGRSSAMAAKTVLGG
jgi:hypothetical protein